MIVLILKFTFILVFVRGQQNLSCPDGYWTIPGFDSTRCFGEVNAKVFYDSYRQCINQDAKMFEPKSEWESHKMWQYINETYSPVNTLPPWYLWINYHDISTKLLLSEWQSEVDGKGPLVINSTYMGSLTTFQQMPNDFWADLSDKHNRPYGKHCAGYTDENKHYPRWKGGVYLLDDSDAATSLCEKPAIIPGELDEF